jgi:mRNA-degrading endonuclease toxin of MazEF toxin-antitoxin module
MNQWEIWYVKQQNARKELKPVQPNDPSDYDRMYVVVADPTGSSTMICCPVQNSLSGVALTEVELKKGYTTGITKDCKIVSHEIYTLPRHFFDRKVGYIRVSEQDKIKTSLILVFDL